MDPVRLQIELRGDEHSKSRNRNLNRARGAVFLLLGSAYALLEQQNALAVYENGPGALNLPFRASEVGLDHSRGVHPSFLGLDEPTWFPRYRIWTLRYTIRSLAGPKLKCVRVFNKMNLSTVAGITQSCDRSPRNKIKQCGTCSSCILRRQALCSLLAFPIRQNILSTRELISSAQKYLAESHLPYMMYQARNLRRVFESEDAWDVLRHKHPTLLGRFFHATSSQHRTFWRRFRSEIS